MVLVPTENFFYQFGRMLFGYRKPEDHYHSARTIETVVEKYFRPEAKSHLPIGVPGFLSVYRLGRFVKAGRRQG